MAAEGMAKSAHQSPSCAWILFSGQIALHCTVQTATLLRARERERERSQHFRDPTDRGRIVPHARARVEWVTENIRPIHSASALCLALCSALLPMRASIFGLTLIWIGLVVASDGPSLYLQAATALSKGDKLGALSLLTATLQKQPSLTSVRDFQTSMTSSVISSHCFAALLLCKSNCPYSAIRVASVKLAKN